MYNIVRTLAVIMVKLFFPTKIVGRNNFIDSGCVIVCNHYSGWDIPIAYTASPYKMIILGKKELINHKIFGKFLRSLGAIPVDRQNVSPSTIKEILNKLKNGSKLMLYPEGTRNKTEQGLLNALKNGASLFALSSNIPVIPMMLDKKPKVFRRNIIMVGKPIYFEGLKPNKEGIEKASGIIREKMEEVKADIAVYKQQTAKK